MRVLGKLFRRLFLTRLVELHEASRLQFFGDRLGLADRRAFQRHLASVRKKRWVVYAKPPFAGPEAVLAYLSRYTHRVAISNRRLLTLDDAGVTFRVKDYRRDGADRHRTGAAAVDARTADIRLPFGGHRSRDLVAAPDFVALKKRCADLLRRNVRSVGEERLTPLGRPRSTMR